MSIAVCWWSGGVTSAVATKIALETYDEVQIYFCETGQHHEDNLRFKSECECWYGQKIYTLNNKKWKNVETVLAHGFINSPSGAFCTKLLKKDVRKWIERTVDFDASVFGFEFEPRQVRRAERYVATNADSKAAFPLIERQLNKKACMEILLKEGIELPAMYRMGYNNANCIGCVKGGMGYWNKIRIDFPAIFDRTAALERRAGRSCIKGIFLDELDPARGKHDSIDLPECGIACEIQDEET